jgi:hypothetical protein
MIKDKCYSIFRMKLTYAICVCTEARELNDLLSFLKRVKDEEDEINILLDASKVTDEVRNVLKRYNGLTVSERAFCGNFSDHRNYHASLCTGDYIFVIDADEMPRETLIKNIKQIIIDTSAELLYIPRINICPGYTQKWLDKHSFKVNEVGWINWPDYQGRVYKNNGIVKWSKGLHETISGAKNTKGLDAAPDMSLWHIKSVEKQEYQDIFYKSLPSS